MKKRYKSGESLYQKKKSKKKSFAIRIGISVVVFAVVFALSDNIPSMTAAVRRLTNENITSNDVKKYASVVADTAKEIKSVVPVFKETTKEITPPSEQVNIDEKDDNIETSIVFRAPYVGEITSPYGERLHPVDNQSKFHSGIDIAGVMGETVISGAPGKVVSVGYDEYNGYHLTIRHNEKYSTSYAHLSKICVIEGEVVDGNTKIGEIGSTGLSTGAHLHFCIYEDGETIDPETFIKLDHRK